MTTDPAPRRHGDTPFLIERTIAAPRQRVWRAWTDRDELQRWFGPVGLIMPVCTLDLRPGGRFHYALRTPDGQDWWGTWTFRDIIVPERLSVIVAFSNAQGGVTRHPLSATWPLETLGDTTFSEHAGGTTMRVRWSVWNGSEDEHRTFDAGHAEMRQGWSGTFDNLERHLAKG